MVATGDPLHHRIQSVSVSMALASRHSHSTSGGISSREGWKLPAIVTHLVDGLRGSAGQWASSSAVTTGAPGVRS